jgi:hypothetical protein
MERKHGVRRLTPWMLTFVVLCVPLVSEAQVGISITVAPPPLPVYEQPPIPEPGYLWTPGYWAYGPEGYFWVPGTWVMPPEPGLLWTPGYWGWSDGIFVWNQGYWAPAIGFYGGVNYGFGYPGRGYEGGYWRDRQFYYNRAVNNVTNVHIQNVYSKTVVNNVTVNKVSYVGGPGGTAARPTTQEQQIAHERHTPPTSVQQQHRDSAGSRHELLATVNHGAPQMAATPKPNDFSNRGLRVSEASRPAAATAREAGGNREATAEQHAVTGSAPQPPRPSSANSNPSHAKSPPPAAPSGSATPEDRPDARQQAQVQAQRNQTQMQKQEHATFSQQPPEPTRAAPQPTERPHQQPPQQSRPSHAAEPQPKQPPPAEPRATPSPRQSEPPHDSSH